MNVIEHSPVEQYQQEIGERERQSRREIKRSQPVFAG